MRIALEFMGLERVKAQTLLIREGDLTSPDLMLAMLKGEVVLRR